MCLRQKARSVSLHMLYIQTYIQVEVWTVQLPAPVIPPVMAAPRFWWNAWHTGTHVAELRPSEQGKLSWRAVRADGHVFTAPANSESRGVTVLAVRLTKSPEQDTSLLQQYYLQRTCTSESLWCETSSAFSSSSVILNRNNQRWKKIKCVWVKHGQYIDVIFSRFFSVIRRCYGCRGPLI